MPGAPSDYGSSLQGMSRAPYTRMLTLLHVQGTIYPYAGLIYLYLVHRGGYGYDACEDHTPVCWPCSAPYSLTPSHTASCWASTCCPIQPHAVQYSLTLGLGMLPQTASRWQHKASWLPSAHCLGDPPSSPNPNSNPNPNLAVPSRSHTTGNPSSIPGSSLENTHLTVTVTATLTLTRMCQKTYLTLTLILTLSLTLILTLSLTLIQPLPLLS